MIHNLPDYEKTSLRAIFNSVKPEKISGILEILLESFKNRFTDGYSLEIAGILEKTIHQIQKAEKKTFINRL